ncbi:hypothetical protein CVT24_001419 [Panaeolus cyanescens]|uniref:Translation initiation factor eIF4e n=1 Tax=Panaeolus cyanescens TaxID=181874 RepID=A0A409WIV2_9AGAR|nr:hypothetical protein CVT24_001419 [Panaeolus cyanescens]
MSSQDTTTSTSSSSSSTIKKPPNNRLPSLNQLAARISSKAAAAESSAANASGGGVPSITTAGTTSAPRPRLAAFASLRTGSTTSLGSTAASTTDSVAVNPPSTRSVSPATSNASAATGGGGANAITPPGNANVELGGGDALTADKLEKLNEETTPSIPSLDPPVGIVQQQVKPLVPLPLAAQPEVPKKKVGYKNIPSLDAITARLAKAKAVQLSVDGSAMPPEPEMIEDPKTPGVAIKAPEHPLQFAWTIYHDTKAKYPYTPASASVGINNFNQPQPGHHSASSSADVTSAGFPHPPEGSEYEANLTLIGEFNTVEEFCRYFNWLKPPSKLEKNSNYHIFKSGIKPMWEDPRNSNGGKWVLTMKNNPGLLDRCWSWLAMALVGEELEDGLGSGGEDKKDKEKKGGEDDDEDDEDMGEICGAVVSLRSKVDRIQLWIKSKDDVERVNAIGKRLVKLLDVSEADNIGLEFQYNSDDRPPPNKFLSIQAVPQSSFRPSFQGPPGTQLPQPGGAGGAAGGAFGGFGTGMGIGGAGLWKAGGKRQ